MSMSLCPAARTACLCHKPPLMHGTSLHQPVHTHQTDLSVNPASCCNLLGAANACKSIGHD